MPTVLSTDLTRTALNADETTRIIILFVQIAAQSWLKVNRQKKEETTKGEQHGRIILLTARC